MLFNSWVFLIFLAITFVLYYAPWSKGRYGKQWQVTLVLIASVIFYGWENPKLIFLLAISCVGNSFATGQIIRYKIANDEAAVKKWTRWAVFMNFSLLFVYKYTPFIATFLPIIPDSVVSYFKHNLPIGISFYTFHGISMIVDVARGEVNQEGGALMKRDRKFITGVRDIGFYLLFFPQLVAGPIVKAREFWPQICAKSFADIRWGFVVRSLIAGYFFKMVIADNLAEQTATLQLGAVKLSSMRPFDLIPLLYNYSFQIFADFAGYSLIALGLAALFGYRFPINFNFPYISKSITEFWRRWHMSLSSWLRDYLYIPLGGNKKGAVRTYINLFLVMFLGGLWHGAEWKFALWGTAHGLLLAIERFFGLAKSNDADDTVWHKFKTCLKVFITFHFVTLLWLTFLMPDLASIKAFFVGCMNRDYGFSGPFIFSLAFYGSWVVLYHAWGYLKEHRGMLSERLSNSLAEPIVLGVMFFMIVTNSGAPSGFIYFQF